MVHLQSKATFLCVEKSESGREEKDKKNGSPSEGKWREKCCLPILFRPLLIVWVLEKLTEALQGLLSFPLLTGINVLTAIVG